jgi:protein-disulfide isomerase
MAALLMKGGPIAYARRAMGSPLAAWRVIRSRNEPAMSRGGLGFARATVLALAAAAVFANFTLPAKLRRDAIDAEPLIQDYMRRPRARFDVSPGSLVKGPPDAPIEIVVFTDFECPYCRHFHGRLDRILEKFPGQYRLIYKHYPVSDICNPIFQGSPARAQHPRACRMAQLAQAMGEMGKFWDASADLYGAQGIFNLNMVAEEIARRAGVELGEWAALAESPAIRAAVEADIREGNRLRLVETPAMWINGRRASPARDDIIERMLRIALMEGR